MVEAEKARPDGAAEEPARQRAKTATSSSGAQQMKMLRRLPKILRFIPGTAQDVRAYFLTLQYWLAGSDENIANMVRFLVDRYADGPRAALRGTLKPPPPAEYPRGRRLPPDAARRGSPKRLDELPARASAAGTRRPAAAALLCAGRRQRPL
ncbi:MAG: DUF3479 domain-containing protein [Burkholderiaceae bacterium]|nr:DUF3479 domain-containing protein [Burkholderiaceae bacterium]